MALLALYTGASIQHLILMVWQPSTCLRSYYNTTAFLQISTYHSNHISIHNQYKYNK